MAQDQSGFIPDTPDSKSDSGFIPDVEDSGFIPDAKVPVRAQGAGPKATGTPPLPGPSMQAYEPSLRERFMEEMEDSHREGRMPHLPDIPWITKPPEFITKGAKSVSDYLTTPSAHEDEHPVKARVKGFVGGAVEGAATQATGLNVGLALAGQGEVSALKSASTLSALGDTAAAGKAFRTARNLELATKAASIPVGYDSLATVTDPNATNLERVQALPGLAGAALGLRSRVRDIATRTPVREVPIKEGSVVGETTPEVNLKPKAIEGEVLEAKPETALTKPETKVTRPDTLTIKMGPKTVENMQKMIGEGYRVKSANAEEVVLTKEAEPTVTPDGTEALFQKVHGGIDEHTAIIEDERPMWEGVGDNGESYHSVGTPVKSADGQWHLSHGILTPEVEAELQAQGIKLIKRSEMNNQNVVPMEDNPEVSQNTFGVPQESLTPADRTVTDTRLDDLTQKFANMATARTPPESAVSEGRRQELLGKLGGTQSGEVDLNTPLMSRVVDESGQPVQTKEFTPEELAARKKQIATDWYHARTEAKALGIDHNKYRSLPELRAAIEANKPQAARTETGRAKIGVNVARSAQELTTGYSGPLPGIMVREGLQNAFDAMKAVGGGEVNINVDRGKTDPGSDNRGPASIEIQDFGKGMTRQELETVFSNLHESGKIDQAGATGGKGVGKASYMLGGQHFKVETVVEERGKKLMNSFQGTPEELMSGFDINTTEVPKNTPTGTRIKTTLKEDQGHYHAGGMVEKIKQYSRNIPVKLGTTSWGSKETTPLKSFKDDSKIGERTISNSKVAVYIPKNAKSSRSTYLELKILNNGMYQYNDTMYLGEEVEVPKDVLIDVNPQMEEGSPEYPFPVQRESVKEDIRKEIHELVKDSLINPLTRKRGNELSMFWNNLPEFKLPNSIRDTLLFDSGSRLNPPEQYEMMNSPVMQALTQQIDVLIDDILSSSNPGQIIKPGSKANRADEADIPDEIVEHDWSNKVKKVGIILDNEVHGIHIPDPSTKGATSAILINPFNHINRHSPERAAMDIVVTALHEVAHVGKVVNPAGPELLPEDLEDPRVGAFLQTYLKEVKEQGGLDLGHGFDFVKRLGDVYARFGTKQAFNHIDAITGILSDAGEGNTGNYGSEVQRLLHIYNESRRRPEVKPDILSRTGIKSSVKGTGKSPNAGHFSADGNGVTRLTLKGLGPESTLNKGEQKKIRRDALDLGLQPTGFSDKAGNPIWQKPKDQETSVFNEIWNLPRGLMSVDLPFITSAAMRQGVPLIGPNFKGWVKAWVNSARAYSSAQAAAQVTDSIAQMPIFRRGRDSNGKPTPSFAEKVGLEMSDTQSLTGREEMLKSKWSERIPVYGKHVTASNRAYGAFMNTLRGTSMTRFMHQATEDSLMFRLTGGRFGVEGRDPTENIVLARSIADAVNTLSGRGKLQLEVIPETRFTKSRTYSAERASRLLSDIFFAPKLVASRMKMLNPNTYISADPFTRKLYMKGILSAIGTWWTIAALMEASGADVSKDPNDADFGKARIGDTRIDPGAGFQQFLVLGSRLRPSMLRVPFPVPVPPYGEPVEDPGGQLFTSSTSGKTRSLAEGFRPITMGELGQNFVRSKFNPTTGLIVDLLYATQDRKVFVGDRSIQMVAPMMAGDLVQVMQENPDLMPLVLGASNVGMGGSTYSGGPTKPTFTPAIEQLTGVPVTEHDLSFPRR